MLEVVARQVAALLLGARLAASPAAVEAAASPGATFNFGSSVLVTGLAPQPTNAAEPSGMHSARERDPETRAPELDWRRSAEASAARASLSTPSVPPASHSGRSATSEQSPKRWLSRAALWTAPLVVALLVTSVLLTTRTAPDALPPATALESPPAPAPQSRCPRRDPRPGCPRPTRLRPRP